MRSNSYDIFVSYAHVDDDPMPGIDRGWVSIFVEGLCKELARELGRRDAFSLWMDYELRGHEPLTTAIRGHLSTAKILVLFLSTGYLASRWCMEELETFAARVSADAGCIFPVFVSPVQEVPEALRDLPMYIFWLDETEGPRTLGHRHGTGVLRSYPPTLPRARREIERHLPKHPNNGWVHRLCQWRRVGYRTVACNCRQTQRTRLRLHASPLRA